MNVCIIYLTDFKKKEVGCGRRGAACESTDSKRVCGFESQSGKLIIFIPFMLYVRWQLGTEYVNTRFPVLPTGVTQSVIFFCYFEK